MVDLMGGQFSKPLVANRVTHLICYKFEGESFMNIGDMCSFWVGVENKHLIEVIFFLLRRKI